MLWLTLSGSNYLCLETILHVSKDVRAIEVRLYTDDYTDDYTDHTAGNENAVLGLRMTAFIIRYIFCAQLLKHR